MNIKTKSRFLWRSLRARFRDNRTELQALKKHIQPHYTVCDIGANKGSYLLWLSRWASDGKVVAFEPQHQLAEYLRSVTQLLKQTNIIIEPKAVALQSGTAQLYIPGGSVSPGASLSTKIAQREECAVETVEVVALDDYFAPEDHVGALKIDVEGGELGVFKSASRILETCRPILIFECENRHLQDGDVFDVFNYLYELNYYGQFIYNHKKIDMQHFDPQKHQKSIGERFWDKKDYVNNFIFYPHE